MMQSAADFSSVETLIFDLDGTLIDSATLVGRILNGMRDEKRLAPLEPDFYRRWSSRGGVELVGRAMDIAVTDAGPYVDEFRRRYRNLPTPQDSLFPGVRDTLAALRADGVKLALCSNKPEHLCRKVLSETGLKRYFSVIVGGDTTPFAKPHPAPLRQAMTAIAATPGTGWMIGDSTVDQKTAAACAVPFIWFTAGYDDGVDGSLATASIAAIPDLLTLLQSAAPRRKRAAG